MNAMGEIQMNFGRMIIPYSNCGKLGIKIDNKLTFEPHVRSLCKRASQKVNVFARIAFSLKSK